MTANVPASTPAPTAAAYDEVPYPSFPVFYASLDHLAGTASLFGVNAASPERCRVLELGSADGGNLLPMAQVLPESQFLGIDLSDVQIRQGKAVIDAIGSKNVELRTASILDVTPDWGKFDYILCHGVFSWVPQNVRDKVLDICQQNLAPHGVAYVSYNTYPGWHMKQMVREMMVFHASRFKDPKDKVHQSRALLDFLHKSVPADANPAYSAMLKNTVETISQQPNYYLLHEYLEDINEPLYFFQFVNQIVPRKLQYLGETHLALMSPMAFAPEIEKTLRHVAPDIIHMEQYMDFLRNRAFRQTLLCHADIPLTRNIGGALARGKYYAAQVKPAGHVDLGSNSNDAFVAEAGMTMNSSDPLTKAALLCFAERPNTYLAFEELLDDARTRVKMPVGPENEHVFADNLMRLYASNVVHMRLRPQDWASSVPERPRATALARYQASTRNPVSSLGHDVPAITLVEYALLPLLDGTRDRAALMEAMRNLFQQGVLNIENGPNPAANPAAYEQIVGRVVDQGLKKLLETRMILRE